MEVRALFGRIVLRWKHQQLPKLVPSRFLDSSPHWRCTNTTGLHTLHSPPKKASKPQIEIWSTRNQWSWEPLWIKSAYTLVTLGPFESPFTLGPKVFAHYNCCWGSFENKVAYFHITFAILGLFERVELTHYSCYCDPLESRVAYNWSWWHSPFGSRRLIRNGAVLHRGLCVTIPKI